MAIRVLKIVLVAFIGLQGFLYVAGNVANWSAGMGFVGHVLGMEGHQAYGTPIFPRITSPAAVAGAFVVIIVGEFLVGALSFRGVWDLWRARHGSAAEFQAAKTFAILGSGMAMVVWLGGFVVIGGALFQMWQTQIGGGSFGNAAIFATTSGIVLLFVNAPESPGPRAAGP